MLEGNPPSTWSETYRACGFDTTGVSELLELRAGGVTFTVQPQRWGTLALEVRYRHPRAQGQFSYAVPPEWEALRVRHLLFVILRGFGPPGRPPADEVFPLAVDDAIDLTRQSLDLGRFWRGIWGDPDIGPRVSLPVGESLLQRAALTVARTVDDGALLTRLADSHPDDEVRTTALTNSACPDAALHAAAADTNSAIRWALLRRKDLPAETMTRLAWHVAARESTLGPDDDLDSPKVPARHRGIVLELATDRRCPVELLPGLVREVMDGGTGYRIRLIERSQQLGMDRLELVCTVLLARARTSPGADVVMDAVVRTMDARGEDGWSWLLNHRLAGVRRLAADRQARRDREAT
ncbi:hypothetical protein ACI79D_13990 [Geodermatophilus sp. SYSU D00708]